MTTTCVIPTPTLLGYDDFVEYNFVSVDLSFGRYDDPGTTHVIFVFKKSATLQRTVRPGPLCTTEYNT
jgi:hypothetical protein